MIGNGITNLIEKGAGGLAPTDKLKREFKEEYQARQLDKTLPYPGVTKLLSALSERGLALGVLSNKDDENTQIIVSHFFPNIFKVVRGALPDIPLKPDPTGALALTKALGATAEQTLYVGDSAVDMLTAKNAGLLPLGAAWGFRPASELLKAGASAILAGPLGLLDYLDAIS
jgi:phosphoglycolate phosphatase